MNKLKEYSDEEIAAYFKDHNISETAKHFNVCYTTMYSRLENIDCITVKRKFFDWDNSDNLEYLRTHTIKDSAKHFNIAPGYLRNMCKTKDISYIKGNKRSHVKMSGRDIRNEMIKYLSEKFSQTDIADVFNLTPQSINMIIKE